MEELTSETAAPKKPANGRRHNGRPAGTPTTEASTLCARVRAASGLTQDDFAREIGAREKTVRNYEKLQIIPQKGSKRTALENLARRYDIEIKEPDA